jgi:hypothetical protein
LPVGPAGPAGLAAGSAGPAAAAEPLAEQAAAAAAAAAAPGPAGAITLLRGAGLLLLAPNSKLWCQLSKPLGGSCSIRNTTDSRYTVAQLMTSTCRLASSRTCKCVLLLSLLLVAGP